AAGKLARYGVEFGERAEDVDVGRKPLVQGLLRDACSSFEFHPAAAQLLLASEHKNDDAGDQCNDLRYPDRYRAIPPYGARLCEGDKHEWEQHQHAEAVTDPPRPPAEQDIGWQ